MQLDYTIRVRDTRGLLHELLDAAVTEAPGELTMFAPTVDKEKVHVRARLFYSDGSDRIVRQNTEPE